MTPSQTRMQIAAAYFGNAYEHYDTALYGLLAPYLAPIFFPQNDPFVALILSYALIPLGMLARPIGAFVISSVGDRFGRETALYYSLLGMGISSFAIGFLPLYSEAGWIAPAALTIGRMLQNFFAAGEIMGGAIYVLENSPAKKADFLSSLYNGSTVSGIIIAAAAVSYLSYHHQVEESWRLLYSVGGGAAIVGSFIRKQAPKSIRALKMERSSIWHLLFKNRRIVFQVALASGFSYACFSAAFVLTNGMTPLVALVSKEEMSHLNTALLILDLALLPFCGLLASRFERKNWMLAASLTVAVLTVPLFHAIDGANIIKVIVIRSTLVFLGVWFSSTLHSWSQELVEKEHRYRLISVSYALGTQLIGSPTTFISLFLYHQIGVTAAAGLYVGMLAVFTSIAFAFYPCRVPIAKNTFIHEPV